MTQSSLMFVSKAKGLTKEWSQTNASLWSYCQKPACLIYIGLYYKCFSVTFYDCNDNGRYYKTTIVDSLALARIIYYNCRYSAS